MSKTIIRTLHCICSFDNKLGGGVHAALNVCKYLALDGHPVETAATHDNADDTGYLVQKYPEVTCHKLKRSFPGRYCNSHEYVRWLRNNVRRFQIVEIHGIFTLSTYWAARICQQLSVPYLVRPHGSLDPFDLKKHALLKKALGPVFVRWLLKHSAGVVCTSKLEADLLVTYGAKPRRYILPLPVPLPETPGNGPAFRQRHKIPVDAQVVLFMSRVDYKKGLDFLIPALGRLKAECPKLWFVLAGTGETDFVAKVHSWIEAHGVRPFTTVTGFVTGQEKLDTLAAADIFALTSLHENFGIVIIEAMNAV